MMSKSWVLGMFDFLIKTKQRTILINFVLSLGWKAHCSLDRFSECAVIYLNEWKVNSNKKDNSGKWHAAMKWHFLNEQISVITSPHFNDIEEECNLLFWSLYYPCRALIARAGAFRRFMPWGKNVHIYCMTPPKDPCVLGQWEERICMFYVSSYNASSMYNVKLSPMYRLFTKTSRSFCLIKSLYGSPFDTAYVP